MRYSNLFKEDKEIIVKNFELWFVYRIIHPVLK